jgi:hypothetical protein
MSRVIAGMRSCAPASARGASAPVRQLVECPSPCSREADLLQVKYENRSKRKRSRTIAAGAERRFLSPDKRRDRDRKVERIVALAQEGRFAPSLYPVAAAIGFGPDDLLRLPPDVAAGVAEAQEALDCGPPKLRRNLMSLVESVGTHALLREHPMDLLAVLRTKAGQAAALSFDRSIRCNEAAAGQAIGWASAEVTGVEAQRAINAGSRAMDMVLRADFARVKLLTDTAKAEKAGVPREALTDEERRSRRIGDRLMSHWASQIDLSKPRIEIADDAAEAGLAANRHATPCTVSEEETSGSERRLGRGSAATCPAGQSVLQVMPAGSRRSDLDSIEAHGGTEGDTAWTDRRLAAGSDASPSEDGPDRAPAADRHATPCTVSDGGTAGLARRPDRGPGATCPAGSFSVEDTMTPTDQVAAEPRLRRHSDQETRETEGEEGANRHATSCTVSDDGERAPGDTLEIIGGNDMASATGDAEVPASLSLPLAERRVDAAETLRALDRAAAADDPADSWEAEVLAIAVRTGKASASIVARFVEEASTVPIFPEPGMANRARPPMHHYLERLSPRGWPRVTATGSSSISLMA